jgi:hypothetical protein
MENCGQARPGAGACPNWYQLPSPENSSDEISATLSDFAARAKVDPVCRRLPQWQRRR